LKAIADIQNDRSIAVLADRYTALAAEMRQNIQTSIEATIAVSTPEMRAAGIRPASRMTPCASQPSCLAMRTTAS
jgi:hypothetical protein